MLIFASETRRTKPTFAVGEKVSTKFGNGTIIKTTEYDNAPGHFVHQVAIGNTTHLVSDIALEQHRDGIKLPLNGEKLMKKPVLELCICTSTASYHGKEGAEELSEKPAANCDNKDCPYVVGGETFRECGVMWNASMAALRGSAAPSVPPEPAESHKETSTKKTAKTAKKTTKKAAKTAKK